MDRRHPHHPVTPCDGCPRVERRDFLKQAAVVLTGLTASLSGFPAGAAALALRPVRALASAGELLTYPVPATDGVQIDSEHEVIVVRWQGKAYAFNLSCPHQHTALRWRAEDHVFQCPKHRSRYEPAGSFISGRATRSMDRLAVRHEGTNLVVDTSAMVRQDQDRAAWEAAFVTL